MAIDYGIQVPQIQPVQPTNMLQQLMMFNQVNEARREVEEKNALRALLSRPGIDPSSPDTLRQIVSVAPKAGPAVVAALARANHDQRSSEKLSKEGALSDEQRKTAAAQRFRDSIPAIMAHPNPAQAYKDAQARFTQEWGQNGNPTEYPGPEGLQKLAMNAQQFIEANKRRYQTMGGVPYMEGEDGSLIEPRVIPMQPGGPTPAPGGLQADVTGVPSYPVNPARMAQMRQAGQTYAPELMTDAAPAPPMPPARPPEAANAMSPYGGLPSTNAMARQPVGASAALQSQKDLEAERAVQIDAMKKDRERVAKKVEALPTVQSNARASLDSLDQQMREIDELLTRPGRSMTTGPIMGRLPNVAPFDLTGAAGAQAVIDRIKSQSGLTALQELRKNSPTGGALGNVSNQEGQRLENSAAALAQTQGTPDFDKQLKKYRADLLLAKQRIAEAYKREYGEDMPAELQTNRASGGAARKDDLTVIAPNGAEYKFTDKAAADQFLSSISKGQ